MRRAFGSQISRLRAHREETARNWKTARKREAGGAPVTSLRFLRESVMTACHPVPHKRERVGVYELQILRGAAKGIRVPLWVPRRLIAEYVECAVEYGEEHAAGHVSKIKQELSLHEIERDMK